MNLYIVTVDYFADVLETHYQIDSIHDTVEGAQARVKDIHGRHPTAYVAVAVEQLWEAQSESRTG